MNRKLIFLLISVILSTFVIAGVSASDNVTADNSNNDSQVVKQTPVISVNASTVYTGHYIGISLKDSNSTPISNQKISVKINKGNYSLPTDANGVSSLKLVLKPNKYALNVFFEGNDNYASYNKTFNINVIKMGSTITPVDTSVFKNKYFYACLKDNFGNPVKNAKVSFTVNKKTYTSKTNEKGIASFKNTLNPNAKYSLKISFAGTDYFNPVSKTVTLFVPAKTSIVIGNSKLYTKGYLRVYLKSPTFSAISKQKIVIKVGQKTFTKTTNDEGIIVFNPKAGTGNQLINVTFAGTSTVKGSTSIKEVMGIAGGVKNPTKTKIPLVNGVPDIDVMPKNYVMGDGDMKYTLLKSQYQETIKRDSYYLYLYNKMTKYVYFKTKQAPGLQHVIVREKWNVIEREIITKIVIANNPNYWPKQITVNLKDKSYTYSQDRDVQNVRYTCGPTSCSMCTQFLKSYVCEKQLAKLAGASPSSGTSTNGLKASLEKFNFKCEIYYKSSFDKALNELKKGGCALVFHTWNHYVAILDISKDGKKVLVGNPSGDYDHGSHDIPTNWVTVKYMKSKFNNYDTSGLIVKLKYNLKASTKNQLKNTYSSFGAGWTAQNTNERIYQYYDD